MNASAALAWLSAGLVAAWGIAHVIPTRAVVQGFGSITRDNRLVLTQEWLAEALTMGFVAAIIIIATAVANAGAVAPWVYRAAAVMLVAVGVLTTATGARTPVMWFKICPIVLTTTAALLLIASWL
ncbi:MAG: hypothetical protein ACHQ4F_11665 [Candidatus Dormibacteria bacterium]